MAKQIICWEDNYGRSCDTELGAKFADLEIAIEDSKDRFKEVLMTDEVRNAIRELNKLTIDPPAYKASEE